jgi:predicted ATPase
MEELNNVVFQNKEGISFFNYRMKMLDFRDKANEIQQNIDELFGIINELFQDTGKTISISKGNNSTLIFHQNENTLHLEQLSSGEKQLLLILLKVFLQEKKPAIIFMDEPEISLHIRWQREIIDRIRQINPSCQIIIATHSPSMFGAGWGDKVVYMEDIIK